MMKKELQQLAQQLEGSLHTDSLMRAIYSTDASVYKEWPLAVATPKTVNDIQQLIAFANTYGTSLIPRAGGTSLAGQCVGQGIVVDISKHFNNIVEINKEEKWVKVQPGVIRDELNAFLKPYGLFFGPNTSTANRAMIGGMVGNNSCGSTSIVYGSTRDHVLTLEVVLSDGSLVEFSPLTKEAFEAKLQGNHLENKLYQQIYKILQRPDQQEAIRENYPKPSIHRRNTGYAVDILLNMLPFSEEGSEFNFCSLLCGSEGTLAFTTEITLKLDPIPAPVDVVVCSHFPTIQDALQAVLVAMSQKPNACELMDKIILDCTKENKEQRKNRFFIEGDPAAILMTEFRGQSKEEVYEKAQALINVLNKAGLGYTHPKVFSPDSGKIWELRKAGLGALANIPGAPKAVACIEDTAVDIKDLPAYIEEFSQIMAEFGQDAVYYAHAGAGELHLRPILDLKKSKDRQLFYDISAASARLVKKYDGSLSGEHGDGRVRAPFIPLMIGEKNYELLKNIKKFWDPNHIFNPGKIVDAPPMNETLRYEADQPNPGPDTLLDFSETDGILRLAEKCNGSGDCRKLAFSGGTMCPSYQATRDEKDTTRARANALREFLSMPNQNNPFDRQELKEVMDLCLSCKGCTSECPSNVDMASMKAEFQYQFYKGKKRPLRDRVFANIVSINKKVAPLYFINNFFFQNQLSSKIIKQALGIASQRSLPKLHPITLKSWCKKNAHQLIAQGTSKAKVWLFIDEFTNYNDVTVGIKAIQLLSRLGYTIQIPEHEDSGRAQLSKGFLQEAKSLAEENVKTLHSIISKDQPLIGIEPSALLSFRDEYPRLVSPTLRPNALALSEHSFLIDEFLSSEIEKGHITSEHFEQTPKSILLHGHCHQKALSDIRHTAISLSIPTNYSVQVIPSGCCGMAGSFGYEKEHYNVSMKIGNLVLFPSINAANEEALIAAPGTSCRHQIFDGTKRKANHPVEILFDALI